MTHFLNTPAARSLSIAQVLRLSDVEAFAMFKSIRFAANGGAEYCPWCGSTKCYTLDETPIRWKCAACRRKFSLTSGTVLHCRKLSLRDILAVIALWANGVKGTSALQMSRNMNVGAKSIFVMLHKLRESLGATLDDGELVGIVEVDGAYVPKRGPKVANKAADRVSRRDTARQVVVVARERDGRARSWVMPSEAAAVPTLRANIASGTEVHAGESPAWNPLHLSYPTKRINHGQQYVGDNGESVNWAESYFSRLRRCQYGQHHRIGGDLLQAYADECSWRENHRR